MSVPDSSVERAEFLKPTPLILPPAATGPAPVGISTTGDPAMNAPWTALGTPAISIPMPVGSELPLGLQMTADLGQDSRLIRAAIQLQARFKTGPNISPA